MRNMVFDCVKPAKNLRKLGGIACESFSTTLWQTRIDAASMWVTGTTFAHTVYTLYTVVSTPKKNILPLSAVYLSPLSTRPITDTTFYKKGEI